MELPPGVADTAPGSTTTSPAAPEPPDSKTKSYQVNEETKVFVSRNMGKVWQGRVDAALKKRESCDLDKAWEQAVRYYENDQISHRSAGADGRAPGNGLADRIDSNFSETENVVYANITSLIPMLYSRNPSVEISSYNTDLQAGIECYKRLISGLFMQKEAPGVNLKKKAQRAVLSAILTNVGYIEVGWTQKQDVVAKALDDYNDIQAKLAEAKDEKEILELEGKLLALEENVSFNEEPGPFIRYRLGKDIIVDPLSVEEDLSDANWLAVREFELTSKLKAQFFHENSDKALYEPKYVLATDQSTGDLSSVVNNFKLFQSDDDHRRAGFGSEQAYDQAKLTETWTIWDKTTKRVYKYNAKNWTYPLWVWDDPLQLSGFFPFARLQFHQSIFGGETKGEVSYYLDQQDGINLWNSIRHQVVSWAVGKLAYNKNKVTEDQAKALLTSPNFHVLGVDVTEGEKIGEMITSLDHPAAKILSQFSKDDMYRAIDKISAVSDVMRGGEFKTNTTNDAVGAYQQAQSTRFGGLIDEIEDFLGQVGWLLLQLCLKNMDIQTVSNIVGKDCAAGWKNLDNDSIKMLSLQVVGGSTQKPTSDAKKQEALEMAQILGQFASVNPLSSVIALKILSKAFNDLVITPTEWKLLLQFVTQAMMPQAPTGDGAVAGEDGEEYSGDAATSTSDPSDVAQETSNGG